MKSKDITIPCRWQVKFRVKPSLKKSEIVDGYEFEVIDKGDNKDTYVTISYETDAYDEKSPDSDKYAEDIIARKYASHIQNLFLEFMIYRRVFGPSEIIIDSITLQNEKKLKEAGLWKKRNYEIHCEPAWWQIPSGSNSLTESHDFWKTGISKGVDGKAKDESMIYAIAELLQLAEIENDDIIRFIFTWNAFNWLYAYFSSITNNKKSKQRDMFKAIIGSLDRDEMNYIIV